MGMGHKNADKLRRGRDTTTPEQRAELRMAIEDRMSDAVCAVLLALLGERDALAANQDALCAEREAVALLVPLGEDACGTVGEQIARYVARLCARIAELEAREPVACGACEGEGAVPDYDAQRHSGELCPRKPCPTCAPFGCRGAVWGTT